MRLAHAGHNRRVSGVASTVQEDSKHGLTGENTKPTQNRCLPSMGTPVSFLVLVDWLLGWRPFTRLKASG